MIRRIVLARHGRSACRHGEWIAAAQMSGWIDEFDRAGIGEQQVPASARRCAAACAEIVCSDLPRAIGSARLLAGAREVRTEGVFREADLPHAPWHRLKLPVAAWSVMFRVAWFLGYAPQVESKAAATRRAMTAAQWLIDRGRECGSILLGHGIMNWLIARQLSKRGAVGSLGARGGYWYCAEYALD